MGSDWQVDSGEGNVSCLISTKDTRLNNENVDGNLSGVEYGFTLSNDRFNKRVSIFSPKNELNWLAECIEGEICWGGFDWCKILSMDCQRNLET